MKTPRFAFPLFLTGSAMLSAGPIFVRVADVGVLQSAFWRLALAVPLLFVLAHMTDRGAPLIPPMRSLPWLFLAGFFFAADLAAWHLGIARTELANAALLGNAAASCFRSGDIWRRGAGPRRWLRWHWAWPCLALPF